MIHESPQSGVVKSEVNISISFQDWFRPLQQQLGLKVNGAQSSF